MGSCTILIIDRSSVQIADDLLVTQENLEKNKQNRCSWIYMNKKYYAKRNII